jgi:uncharacterized protein (DUF1501 family)
VLGGAALTMLRLGPRAQRNALTALPSRFHSHTPFTMTMQYRRLGRAGVRVSTLSLGSWVTYANQVDHKAAVEMMAAAFDAGINFFDNAEVYAGGRSES